jgi:hypothetical protein
LAAGADLTCAYSQSLADNTSGSNTATATLQNYSYAADGTATAGGTTDFASDAVPYAFGDPTTVVNDSVNVEDVADNGNSSLGSYTHSDTITYSRTFTCDSDNGTHDNTASVYGDGNAELGNSSAEVVVKCTSPVTVTPTPQYWCSPGFWANYDKGGKSGTGLLGTAYDPTQYLDDIVPGYTVTVGYALANPSDPAYNAAADYLSAKFFSPNNGTQATGDNCPVDANGSWTAS